MVVSPKLKKMENHIPKRKKGRLTNFEAERVHKEKLIKENILSVKSSIFMDVNNSRWNTLSVIEYSSCNTITNSETFEERTVSITPNKFQSLKLYDAGRYWIEVNVRNDSETMDVFEFYDIKEDLSEQKPIVENSELPERALIILGIIFIIVVIVGLRFRRKDY